MNCKTTLWGVIFGIIAAKRPEITSLHAILAVVLTSVMIFLENLVSKKLQGKKKMLGALNGIIFFSTALIAASLYTKIVNIDYYIIAFSSAIWSIIIFFITTYQK